MKRPGSHVNKARTVTPQLDCHAKPPNQHIAEPPSHQHAPPVMKMCSRLALVGTPHRWTAPHPAASTPPGQTANIKGSGASNSSLLEPTNETRPPRRRHNAVAAGLNTYLGDNYPEPTPAHGRRTPIALATSPSARKCSSRHSEPQRRHLGMVNPPTVSRGVNGATLSSGNQWLRRPPYYRQLRN